MDTEHNILCVHENLTTRLNTSSNQQHFTEYTKEQRPGLPGRCSLVREGRRRRPAAAELGWGTH